MIAMKYLNAFGKLFLIIFLLSASLFLGSGRCINNPNLISSTMRTFEYTEYNSSVEQNNIHANANINDGKIGYVLNNKDKYELALSVGAADTLPIYLTKAQAIRFKHLIESSRPVLVEAKIVDDGNSGDYYNIEVLDTIDNVYGVNCIEDEHNMFLYVMLISGLCLIICIVKVWRE